MIFEKRRNISVIFCSDIDITSNIKTENCYYEHWSKTKYLTKTNDNINKI